MWAGCRLRGGRTGGGGGAESAGPVLHFVFALRVARAHPVRRSRADPPGPKKRGRGRTDRRDRINGSVVLVGRVLEVKRRGPGAGLWDVKPVIGQIRRRRWAAAGALMGACAAWGLCAPTARGDDGEPWTKRIHYGTASGEVRTSTLSWADGVGPTASPPGVVIGGLGAGNASGVVFGRGGEMYVSGNERVRSVRIDEGTGVGSVVWSVVVGAWNGGSATAPTVGRIALSPDGRSVWGAGALMGGIGAGVVDRVPVRPDMEMGTASVVFGPDTLLRSLAFVGERVYYTADAGAPGSGGHFGVLDPAIMGTTRVIAGTPAARALVFDGYTGHLLMMGGGKITQIRVDLLSGGSAMEVSEADVGALGVDIVAGGADGRGRLVAMGSDGRAVVMDYRASRLVGWAGNDIATVVIDPAGGITDMAPLSGPGALLDSTCVWDNGGPDGRGAQHSWRTTSWGSGGGAGTNPDGGRAADDLWVCPEQITRIDAIKVTMLTSALMPKATLEIYEDCDGAPGRLILATGSAWAVNLPSPPPSEGLRPVEVAFLPDALWLDGGRHGRTYWVSVVGLRSEGTTEEYLWMTSGDGAPGVKGRPGAHRPADTGGWTSVDELGCGCTDFAFCAIGETCKVLLDNGSADAAPGGVAGTRGAPSLLAWTGWETRSADDVTTPTCVDTHVCVLEATVYTNCWPVRGVFEVYAAGCIGPDGPALFGAPFEEAMDLGYSVVSGSDVLRAYRVRSSGMDWTLPGGRAYWLAAAVRGSGGLRQKGLLAFAGPSCDRPCRVRWNEGMSIGPLANVSAWTMASVVTGGVPRDFAIRVGVKIDKIKRDTVEPALPVCRSDVNGDGASTVDDLYSFLAQWFTACP